MLRAGDFFTGPYPPGSGKKRRFFILTDEASNHCTVVWVFTSTEMNDLSCIIFANEHSQITQDCTVIYGEATIADANDIRAGVASGALQPHPPLATNILRRAFDALFLSPETPYEVLDYCAELD